MIRDISSPLAAVAALACVNGAVIAAEPAPAMTYTPAADEELDEETLSNINAFLAELKPEKGEISLQRANATLNIPDTHYFLTAADARAVLEQAWGNPPDEDVLGMIFPARSTPVDATAWGAKITYQADGYVSDKDASKIDYDGLLKDIQAGAADENAWRTENGYEAIDIVGWAEPPSYNAETHKMYWAKELKFGEATLNTLNYDIRVLGRRGVLVISFIADMSQLDDIRATAPSVLQMAEFNTGSTYAEYEPGVDQKAAYGLAGLIGGAAIAKKTGLLAAILIFGKKFIGLIVVGLVALGGAVRKMFGGSK